MEQIDRLQEVQVRLGRQVGELNEERDRLNWTLGVILETQNFPVAYRCPHRGEPHRQADTELSCRAHSGASSQLHDLQTENTVRLACLFL